jgi:signal transduction histidine kinase
VQVRTVATEFLRLRPAIVIPFLAFTVAVIALGGAPSRQVLALGSAATLFSAFFLYERRRGAKEVVDGRVLLRSLVFTMLGIAIGATATGALSSPLLPMFAAPIGIGFAAFGRERASQVLFVLLVAIVVLLFLVSPLAEPLALGESSRRIVLAGALVDSALLLRVGVTSLAAAHGRAAEALVAAGDEIVRSAVARSRSLEALGAKVAHEVKNPLTAVRAMVDLLLETGDEKTKKRLTVAAGEIARIEEIVSSYGSVTHPLEVVRRAPASVLAIAERLVTVLDARAMRAGITLSLDSHEDVDFDLDRDRVGEALLNLLLNALDATPRGGRVTLAYERGEHGDLAVRIRDTGAGMDATTLAKLGTPFFSQREGGTGLGVALARQVAEQHGGTLTYESTKGAGTTATLRIPRSDP